MFLVEPPRSQYDLNFSVFGIPVRVHPMFWLVSLLLGGNQNLGGALRWVAVVFVSILVHELGHALVARSYGARPWITLYSFGGLASYSGARTDTKGRISIILAGPMAGFLLASAIAMVIVLTRHEFEFNFFRWQWRIGAGEPIDLFTQRNLYLTIHSLLYVNIFWGLINLLPVFPLDGGQISMNLFEYSNPRFGSAQALWLSVIVAAGVAGAALVYQRDYFLAFFFGYMAYSSYAILSGGYGPRR